MGASDIHIECFRDTAQIRFRVDGILRIMKDYSKFVFENYNAVVTRIKIISKKEVLSSLSDEFQEVELNSYFLFRDMIIETINK